MPPGFQAVLQDMLGKVHVGSWGLKLSDINEQVSKLAKISLPLFRVALLGMVQGWVWFGLEFLECWFDLGLIDLEIQVAPDSSLKFRQVGEQPVEKQGWAVDQRTVRKSKNCTDTGTFAVADRNVEVNDPGHPVVLATGNA